jgi:hypothetical protein
MPDIQNPRALALKTESRLNMIPLWAIEAGVEGGKALYGLLKPKPKFGATAYGQRLAQRAAKGDIPMEAQQNVISNVAKETGNAASIQKAEEQGRLASTGMGRSISGTAGLRDIGTRYQDRLATVSRDLAAQNEVTKEAAKNELAQENTAWDEQRRQDTASNVAGLFGAVGQGVLAKYKENNSIGNIFKSFQEGGLSADEFTKKLLDSGMKPEDIRILIGGMGQR